MNRIASLNLANKLTLLRMTAVPALVILLVDPTRWSNLIAALIFFIAALTDLVDGVIARSQNQVTTLGKFLDPMADKLLVCSALVMLVELARVPGWAVAVMIGRETLVTGLRAVAADQGVVIAADRYGKLKTVLQTAALCPLILCDPWFGFDPMPAGLALFYASLVLAVGSGINYLRLFASALRG